MPSFVGAQRRKTESCLVDFAAREKQQTVCGGRRIDAARSMTGRFGCCRHLLPTVFRWVWSGLARRAQCGPCPQHGRTLPPPNAMLTLALSLALAQLTVQDEGANLGSAWRLNCSGTGITCSRNAATKTVTLNVSAAELGGGVPGSIPAVTYSASGDLSAERTLTAGTNVSLDTGTPGQLIVGVTGTVASATTATTAGALTSNPTDCAGGTYATAIDASGNLTCSTPPGTYSLPDSTAGTTGGIRLTGDLAGTATAPAVVDDSHAHTSATISSLDTSDITTGTLPAARGGLGQAQPTCASTQALTCNGTTCSCVTLPEAVLRVTGNVTNSTTTPATVTGLSFTAAASTDYRIRCVLSALGTSTSLPRFNISGPASPTVVTLETRRYTTTSAATLLVLNAFSATAQTASCTTSCATTALPVFIEGVVRNGSNSGTVAIQVASSTAGQTVTIHAGSACTVSPAP